MMFDCTSISHTQLLRKKQFFISSCSLVGYSTMTKMVDISSNSNYHGLRLMKVGKFIKVLLVPHVAINRFVYSCSV